ncbi:TAT-variant-translocated molybdopterin oxidoreductase [Catalinimonas niigatensis]|uniref:TAT-variant-translocated molybdopterin oxidoreductase n=1 Tax=Catalinimonas niigatensis TaxID=1397264 RepID=UPI0026668624|nr:TAT-variant-translocated molybdopterin oxidoreductase [Catalinimonas niigatensis]WPP51517.1 TAT-variant-translocated molybdopterin oxidoreductase [Catalinimonas niigatensis]
MANHKKYWQGLEQLKNDPEFVKHANKEFPEYLPIDEKKRNGEVSDGSSRRDFLKMMGFGISAATLAACEAPLRKAIPYVVKPVDVDPSIANYYASTYMDGGDYCSIVVKTREGRPIKLKGNDRSSVTMGGMHPQVEASVLSLYDKQRYQTPMANGEPTTWEELDSAVKSGLGKGGRIALVSHTVLSPSTQAAINSMMEAYPSMSHIMYDSQSTDGILVAYQSAIGQRILPTYDFSKANTIVSFSADFLGTWIAPVTYAKQYGQTRKVSQSKKEMSRHYQFESNLSLTGANADYRTQIKPSEEGLVIGQLYNLIASKAGRSSASFNKIEEVKHLQEAANHLWANRGKAIVVAGSNDPVVQGIMIAINDMLGSYGNTIDTERPSYYRKGNSAQMARFVEEVNSGRIDAVIFYNCNPVYDFYNGAVLGEALEKVALRVATSEKPDETAVLCNYVAPDHNFLESWNDAEPQRAKFSLAQPAITPIFNTRQAQSSFLTWSNASNTDYYTFLKNNWRSTLFQAQNTEADFDRFFDLALYDGAMDFDTTIPSPGTGAVGIPSEAISVNLTAFASGINNSYQASEGVDLVLYQKVTIGSGRQANNPWLQENPDPISKACWDNYITVSQKMAEEMGLDYKEGKTSLARLTAGEQNVVLPILVQPGQAEGTVGVALGYGRTVAGLVAEGVGVNAYPLATQVNGQYALYHPNVQIELLDEVYKIAQTQTHNTFMGRETILQEGLLSDYKENPKAGRFEVKIPTAEGPKDPGDISLWKGHKYANHHWNMIIDLNSCIGCNACAVSCQVENNVPVVGRQEVLNRREMHWLRIDRYYSSDEVEDLKGMEKASENPEITFQPMLCQQCNNAPCETVCPVAATTHSTEGLNQMTYNRCIGTRYCANNCPYKVRRFNWFKYHDNEQFAVNTAMNNDLGKMVLNPDVTVRARGVMEKCTFCVQRIQLGKLEAKKAGRRPIDGEINTACAEACPTNAITFGDINDPESSVSQILAEETEGRAYRVLQEINTSPNIWYLTKIRNKDEESPNA